MSRLRSFAVGVLDETLHSGCDGAHAPMGIIRLDSPDRVVGVDDLALKQAAGHSRRSPNETRGVGLRVR